MNGLASPPLDILASGGTEPAGVPRTMKPGPEPSTGSAEARSIAGVYAEASGQVQSVYAAMKQGLLPAGLGLALLEAQAATGGLVDPSRGQLLPVSEALRQGLVGLELKERLLAAERAVTGYPDPYGGGKLALFQAIGKEIVDRALGWSWLDAQLATGGLVDPARGVRVAPDLACQQGLLDQETWQGLVEPELQPEPGTGAPGFLDPNTLERLPYGTLLSRCVQAPGSGLALLPLRVTFHTLGRAVSAGELLEAGILDQEAVQGLQEGRLAVGEVGARPEVRRYLEGTGGVAGVVLLPAGHTKGFFQAASEHLLPLGAVLPLLEAQAATCTLVDPATGRQLWVEEAVRAGLVGPELHHRLLVAEQAVTGYHDPFSGSRVSLFQAMQKGLVDRPLALRLLDAQLATGGIVDPVHSHRLPVGVAYERGYFDEEMNSVLLDPDDDTKGFFDPNTHENLTYLQLLERCVEDPETGLRLLPLSGRQPQLVDGATRQALQSLLLPMKHGRFRGRAVSAWELVNSELFSEARRRQLLRQYRLRRLTLQQVARLLETEARRWAGVTLPALRGRVPAHQLLEAGVIDEELLDRVLEGAVSPEALLRVDSVRRCLRGSGVVGGVLLQPSGRHLSLYQAMEQKLLAPSVALPLLEAQAATGAVRDPCSRESLSVDEAVRRGVVGPELYGRLRWAEDAIVGFRDPFSGKRVSLFQAMKKGLVPVEQATRLLEAQVATGGVVDPRGHHHLPLPVAVQRGCIDEETGTALSGSPETFPTADGQGRTSYAQLLEQCLPDEASGLHLLPLLEGAPALPSDAQLQETLRATPGTEDGRSLWDLLSSCHFTEEQRRALLEDVRVGRTPLPQLQATVRSWVQGAELLAHTHVALPGPRGEVPAAWLRDAEVITQETLEALARGTQSPSEVAEQPAVRACLWGTGCVAGVRLQPSGAKASIAQAVRDGLLPPGLGQRLLEAQVASGSLVDPETNQRLSVDNAVRAGLVDREMSERLRQAEQAVAGYADPYSGGTLSLWQAMEKGLVPQSEGLPLLQVQLATGGVMDTVHGVHLPLAGACKLGLVDEQTHRELTATDEGRKFFFDPNTRAEVTYQQLKERCELDADTGLWLLPLPQAAALEVDEHTAVALRAMKVAVSLGRFQGHSVSLWDLLHSEYVGADRRRELAALCRSGRAAALRQVVSAVTALVEAAEKQPQEATFRGLRKQVSARDLFRSQLIDKKTLDELKEGKKTVQEVTQMRSVRQSLEGGNFIAGVLIQSTREKLSIPEALRRHILRPGTALVLLEAQAATGFIIDPVENRKLTVEQAFEAGMFGRETYMKLLSAERAVTGYTDPYTGEQISLFQAMQKDLIVRDHGIRLLEAQIATGGIIDPVHSHRLPVGVAYERGYFDEEMNRVLRDPSDDTKGFFDPNTHENLTYLQLLERCVPDPDTGLHLLQIVKKGETYSYIDEATRRALLSRTLPVRVGRFAGQTLSFWDLLSSVYFSEERKRELVQQYRAQSLSLEQLLEIITAAVEETETQSQGITVAAPGGQVTAAELFNAGIIDKKTLDTLHSGESGEQALSSLEGVKTFLEGRGCIAGVIVPTTQAVLSFHDASRKELIPAGIAAQLLEAQAATGFLLDPCTHQRLSVDEALAAGLVAQELRASLLNAEQAAKGYVDPDTGDTIPLFQAMKKQLVQKEEALRLLEVQLATGGVLDPLHHHRLPLDTAYRRGCLQEDVYPLVADQKRMKKRFLDPNTQEKVTYQELQERCRTQQETGWALFPVVQGPEHAEYVDEATRRALQEEQVHITVGRYRGQRRSVWELLNSEYVTEERKRELVRLYRTHTAEALGRVRDAVLQLIEEKEAGSQQLWFTGIRKQVTAAELLQAAVISQETLQELQAGTRTVQQLQDSEAVRRYLQGTGCIAGVLLPPSGARPGAPQKMSIYQAMRQGVLRPGTALVLLEAQAATGFVVDPARDRRLSVEEAVAEGVVGGELREKLLSAERAVTGYTDPYTGEQISLFQAMQRDLIVRDHGIRLLEAQIATGGIIDPVHSHRLPVGVAYERGYFDEEMNRVLGDPSDDTKGFFDPNTHENLTYLQLLRRCVPDPDTGLLFLALTLV
uniref:Epiplakin n=1 Tax=Oryctolagus cuniculus TaxID=9986 RepID=A0A5F9DR44_RABIT